MMMQITKKVLYPRGVPTILVETLRKNIILGDEYINLRHRGSTERESDQGCYDFFIGDFRKVVTFAHG